MSAVHSHWNSHLETSVGPNTLSDAVDGKAEAVERVSQSLLTELARREEMTIHGETHVVSRGAAIPDSYVNHLAFLMLRACQWKGQSPPHLLCELIRVQLKVRVLDELETHAYEYELAAGLVAENRNISNREVARLVGVDHTTIRRWRTQSEFQRRVASDRDNHGLSASLDFFLPNRRKTPRS